MHFSPINIYRQNPHPTFLYASLGGRYPFLNISKRLKSVPCFIVMDIQ